MMDSSSADGEDDRFSALPDSFRLDSEQQHIESLNEAVVPLRQVSASLPHRLHNAGMDREQAEMLGESFDRVADSVAYLAETITVSTMRLQSSLYRLLLAEINQRGEESNRRFAEADRRFEQIEKRFEQIDKRFEQIDRRFEQIDRRFEQIEKRLDDISRRIDTQFSWVLRLVMLVVTIGAMGLGGVYYSLDRRMDRIESLLLQVVQNQAATVQSPPAQ